jgi:hypothetical protein
LAKVSVPVAFFPTSFVPVGVNINTGLFGDGFGDSLDNIFVNIGSFT